jgi:hypothetical protein
VEMSATDMIQRLCKYCHRPIKQTKIPVRTVCQCQVPGGRGL